MNAVSADSAALAARGVAYAPEIAGAARRHGLDPRLLAAVAAQETGGPGSNGGSNVVGDGGHGHGVFQIDDRWHAFAKTPAAADPAKNADYAAGMLSGLIARYGGDVHAALSAYNAGSPTATGTKTRWGDGQVLGYADSVLRHEQRIGGSGVPNASPLPADPGEVEACRADSASTSASVNALASQAIALAQLAMTLPSLSAPPALSLPSTAAPQSGSVDATGHSRDPQATDASIVDNEGDD
ncbi:MAG: transglycosylase SLT domain-containing protein [Vulcanimicrobiaceae bacterium]